MVERDLKQLQDSFEPGFSDRVMKRVSEIDGRKDRFVINMYRLSLSAAAAAVLLFIGLNFTSLSNDGIDGVMGLSDYSDYELSEMEYFNVSNDEFKQD